MVHFSDYEKHQNNVFQITFIPSMLFYRYNIYEQQSCTAIFIVRATGCLTFALCIDYWPCTNQYKSCVDTRFTNLRYIIAQDHNPRNINIQ